MLGGSDGTLVYDSGTATATITNNAVSPAVSFTTQAVPWNQGSTPNSLAASLASAINSVAGSIVTAAPNNGSISLHSTSTGAGTNYNVSISFVDSQPTLFPNPSFSANPITMSGGAVAGTGYGTIYSNNVPQGGYAPNGNLLAHTDSVMGTWGFGYDTLNRLTSATSGPNAPTSYANNYGCWTYDAFGNRTLEAFSSVTSAPCASGANDNLQYTATTPTALNQVSGFTYDAAGNVLSDNFNNYRYDPEGRLCAVAYPNGTGGSYYEQYLYDAEGRRVGKGSVGSLTCAAPDAGFTLKSQYLLGQGGEQVTELNGAGAVQHTNAFIGGKLLATYDFINGGLHFALTDPLGTKRVQVSGAGTPELNCLSLPFGSSLGNARATNCVPAPGSIAAADATEHHFTGHERDTESGNDYFMARYYSSAMGRFMSPDDGTDQDPSSPQSWNLYGYVRNNPLINTDPDGHDCVNGSNAADGTVSYTREKNPEGCGAGFTYVNGTVDVNSFNYSNGQLSFNFSNYADGSGTFGNEFMSVGNQADPDTLKAATFGSPSAQTWTNGVGGVYAFGTSEAIGLGLGLGGPAAEIAYGAWRASRLLKAANEAKGDEIAENVVKHAYDKHVVKKGEFGDISPDQFKARVKDTVTNPSDLRSLSNGRTAYWSDSQQMVVIENSTSPSQSTAFRPTNGKSYFLNNLN
jgi:RHS repeat-associated protein